MKPRRKVFFVVLTTTATYMRWEVSVSRPLSSSSYVSVHALSLSSSFLSVLAVWNDIAFFLRRFLVSPNSSSPRLSSAARLLSLLLVSDTLHLPQERSSTSFPFLFPLFFRAFVSSSRVLVFFLAVEKPAFEARRK